MQKILIDRFIVPKSSREEFFERVKINRGFIKTLSGFIQDSAYSREEGNDLVFVTVAVWKDQEAIDNAKKNVFAEYEKQGFDMPAMLRRLGITIDRGIFEEFV
ncbi:antibiotic biosynthesis monooxygenase [Leptospira adleri]|uniref:Antibiotic biosynthesis monooxygenase n=1 Tax=Leptospira adleri TaxID=2023186 RepID=A0A2M9YK07_9LEPT|nr:antibiotic biosynthesis monooxygenase [Leptospira adleri]PJZ51834.1 antibiotic biosynthesis monooxygenase [Leptospira adleri]PJZ62324.1 antibiotic biosynthesis monooxygenase [Leptospira adleri]